MLLYDRVHRNRKQPNRWCRSFRELPQISDNCFIFRIEDASLRYRLTCADAVLTVLATSRKIGHRDSRAIKFQDLNPVIM